MPMIMNDDMSTHLRYQLCDQIGKKTTQKKYIREYDQSSNEKYVRIGRNSPPTRYDQKINRVEVVR